jgi:hypothetical protein
MRVIGVLNARLRDNLLTPKGRGDMITLTDNQVTQLVANMATDDEPGVRYLALTNAQRVEFTDERGESFSHDTVLRICTAARERKYHCYVCKQDKPISEWSRDSSGCDLCEPCYDYAGWENSHSDNDHEHHPDPECPVCANADH